MSDLSPAPTGQSAQHSPGQTTRPTGRQTPTNEQQDAREALASVLFNARGYSTISDPNWTLEKALASPLHWGAAIDYAFTAADAVLTWFATHPLAAVSAAAPDERDALFDFPTAWRLIGQTKADFHHERCSYRSSYGAMLCDCAAIVAAEAGWRDAAALAARPAPVVSGADVDGLSVAIRTWHDATFPGKTNTAVALKMAEEAGEVAGAQTRCDEIADGHRTGEPTAAREHLAKELGDLAIVWLTLCARHDLAPETVVRDRWATIQNRRWTTAEPDAATPVGTKRPCARAGFEEMWDGDRWVPICLDCGDEAAYCDGTRHRTVADAPAAEPGHEFVGVAGHPDDDECTYRADGTDLTYCGLTKAEHDAPAAEAVPIPDCPAVNERRGVRCERPAGHSGRHESEECAWPFPAADDEGARA